MSEEAVLLKKLRGVAASLRIPADQREDFAASAYLKALTAGHLEYGYAAQCLRNEYFVERRNNRTRGSALDLTYDAEGECVELKHLFSHPVQESHLQVVEALQAIGQLSEKIRDVMLLSAMEWSREEIASKLNIPLSEVAWRIGYGRKILRQKGHDEVGATRGHNKYIGIKRAFNKWQASIRDKNEGFRHLGNFDTAAEAARAYDNAAAKLRGEAARVNFPNERN